jgi:hypothetical protein
VWNVLTLVHLGIRKPLQMSEQIKCPLCKRYPKNIAGVGYKLTCLCRIFQQTSWHLDIELANNDWALLCERAALEFNKEARYSEEYD